MKRNIAVLLLLGMLATMLLGCDFGMSGDYVSVEPYKEQNESVEKDVVHVRNSSQMYNAIVDLVESGAQSGIFSVASFTSGSLHFYLDQAIQQAMENNPMCAYAVEKINYEIGTRSGGEAVALTIHYRYELSHLLRIERVDGMDAAISIMEAAMDDCLLSVAVRVPAYQEMDIATMLLEYAIQHPDVVMEIPKVNVSAYPQAGRERIIKVDFTYQTSQEELRRMQSAVEPIFTAAELYVRSASQVREKYSQMYSFLMERSDYEIQTSITPAYSLLNDGVGDCEAFARVYAAMCDRAGLECYVVSGTRDGQPWTWNMINFRGTYYHLDLLRCEEESGFLPKTKSAMTGYQWDAAKYPD